MQNSYVQLSESDSDEDISEDVEKTLKSESHTIDEVMAYIVNVHGFVELDKNLI